jgi:transcriptional regulator with XRE-family HTH domain
MAAREIPVDIQPWAKVTGGRRPETPLQALMEAAPGNHPEQSWEEFQPLREAIAAAIDQLEPQDKFVIEALYAEGLSLRELGERLGLKSKGHISRIRNNAFNNLTPLLLNQPLIRERLNMTISWNEGCRNELAALAPTDSYLTTNLRDLHDYLIELGDPRNPMSSPAELVYVITSIGRTAAALLREHDRWDTTRLETLLCGKQADYGHHNINAFGLVGIAVRLSDKLARYHNLTSTGGSPRNETIEDTLDDLVGYAVVARMFHHRSFNYELESTNG